MHSSSLVSLLWLFNITQPGRKYLEVLRKPLGLSKVGCMQTQANRQDRGTVTCSSSNLLGPLHGDQVGPSHQLSPLEAKTQGSGLGFVPRLGELGRARGGAAGSEGLALPERLQWHCCPLPTPTSLTWAQARYVRNLLEALRARATSQQSLASALKQTHIIAPPSPPRVPKAPKPPSVTALTPKNAGAHPHTGKTTSHNVYGILQQLEKFNLKRIK